MDSNQTHLVTNAFFPPQILASETVDDGPHQTDYVGAGTAGSILPGGPSAHLRVSPTVAHDRNLHWITGFQNGGRGPPEKYSKTK